MRFLISFLTIYCFSYFSLATLEDFVAVSVNIIENPYIDSRVEVSVTNANDFDLICSISIRVRTKTSSGRITGFQTFLMKNYFLKTDEKFNFNFHSKDFITDRLENDEINSLIPDENRIVFSSFAEAITFNTATGSHNSLEASESNTGVSCSEVQSSDLRNGSLADVFASKLIKNAINNGHYDYAEQIRSLMDFPIDTILYVPYSQGNMISTVPYQFLEKNKSNLRPVNQNLESGIHYNISYDPRTENCKMLTYEADDQILEVRHFSNQEPFYGDTCNEGPWTNMLQSTDHCDEFLPIKYTRSGNLVSYLACVMKSHSYERPGICYKDIEFEYLHEFTKCLQDKINEYNYLYEKSVTQSRSCNSINFIKYDSECSQKAKADTFYETKYSKDYNKISASNERYFNTKAKE